MNVTGGCHCGHVRFTATVDPATTRICHCNACQRLTGAPYRVTVSAAAEDVRMTAAEPARYVKTGDSGQRRIQLFCDRCGSPIAVTGEGEAASVWGIRWGAIDQRADLEPHRRIWAEETVPFSLDISGLPAGTGD